VPTVFCSISSGILSLALGPVPHTIGEVAITGKQTGAIAGAIFGAITAIIWVVERHGPQLMERFVGQLSEYLGVEGNTIYGVGLLILGKNFILWVCVGVFGD
jgi:hypothetical protein